MDSGIGGHGPKIRSHMDFTLATHSLGIDGGCSGCQAADGLARAEFAGRTDGGRYGDLSLDKGRGGGLSLYLGGDLGGG